ncbi:MAG: GspE/PulE family protein [Kiritimatiellia bacterium]
MKDLGTLLVEKGLLSAEGLSRAVERARRTRQPLATVLVEEGVLSEAEVLAAAAEQQGVPFVSLDEAEIEPAAVKALPTKLASHYGIMPVRIEGRTLTIAVSNPFDMSPVEDIEVNLGYRVRRVLACRKDIEAALQRYYGLGADTVERILARSPESQQPASGEVPTDLETMARDASIVSLVNELLQDAIRDRATDIHLEVGRTGISVRRRIDGILYDTPMPARVRLLYSAIVSRIKLMSGLNIVERRLPQDGRARVLIGGTPYDLRVSIVPALHGEDVVIRILPSTMLFDLAELGFSSSHLKILEELITMPHGILFVTGPTGSGKSTTLYACLSRLNRRERKIITIEDPVEYELEGVTQTQINPAIGLTFARALRSMLRHDPDVMMVGEVRDRETAEIAIQTAMTGHLVLSTLHTNEAASGAVRLLDMGIDPYLITSTVLAFVAQRLVRVICPACKEAYEVEGRHLHRGKGCKACGNRGYQGRVAICEILPLVSEIQDCILRKASARAIREQADALGMKTLAQDGWEKVEQGITTFEEVLRVTRL